MISPQVELEITWTFHNELTLGVGYRLTMNGIFIVSLGLTKI
jgi:hypothetical protein